MFLKEKFSRCIYIVESNRVVTNIGMWQLLTFLKDPFCFYISTSYCATTVKSKPVLKMSIPVIFFISTLSLPFHFKLYK